MSGTFGIGNFVFVFLYILYLWILLYLFFFLLFRLDWFFGAGMSRLLMIIVILESVFENFRGSKERFLCEGKFLNGILCFLRQVWNYGLEDVWKYLINLLN